MVKLVSKNAGLPEWTKVHFAGSDDAVEGSEGAPFCGFAK